MIKDYFSFEGKKKKGSGNYVCQSPRSVEEFGRDVKSCREIIAEENRKTEMNAYYEEKAAAQVQWSSVSGDPLAS